MNFKPTAIKEVIVIEPTLFEDSRGFFLEAYHAEKFKEIGITQPFVQDNHSKSTQGTLRGLHYQASPKAQGKLVRVVRGRIFDVAVDIRPNSPTYGKWVSEILSEDNKKQLYIPGDFAHGFYVLSGTAEVIYKCTDTYSPAHEKSIRWDDPTLNINWPLLSSAPLLSQKDKEAPVL